MDNSCKRIREDEISEGSKKKQAVCTNSSNDNEKDKNGRDLEEASLGGFPVGVWENVVGFLDIPELGVCSQVCKTLQKVCTKDTVWEGHLKKLLQIVFDSGSAFRIEPKMRTYWEGHLPVPPHKRLPLKSTDFRAWYKEWIGGEEIFLPDHDESRALIYDLLCGSAIRGKYSFFDGNRTQRVVLEHLTGEEGEFCRWLFEDVPLRTYYKEAGKYAYMSYAQEVEAREIDFDDEDGYFGEDGGYYDYDGVFLGVDHDIFVGLPNLKLFGGKGGYPRPRQYWDY